MFHPSNWRSTIWSVQECTWSSPRVKYLPRPNAEATGLSSSRGNVSLCPDPDFTQLKRNHSTYHWWATVPQGVWEVNHQSAIHSPYCNLPNSSLSCNRGTLPRIVLYTRQPFLYVWEVSWTVELLKTCVCTRQTSAFTCLHLIRFGISFASPAPPLSSVDLLSCVHPHYLTLWWARRKKNANQRCSSQLSLKDRGPLFSKIIIIKTHGNTDVAELTFDMSDCRVLEDSFPRDLFPLQVNLYTF